MKIKIGNYVAETLLHPAKLAKGVLLLTVLLFIHSCKEDDEPLVDATNRMIIGDTTIELVSGYIDESPDDQESADLPPENGFAHEILLLSEGLTMNNSTGIVSGTGNPIVFNPFTATEELTAGTYNLPQPYSEKIGFLLDAFGCQGFNSTTENCDIEYEIESGALTVAISGNTYTITFTGKMVYEDEDENEIEVDVNVFYEGTLTAVDL